MKNFGAVGWQSIGKRVGKMSPKKPGPKMARSKN